MKNKMTKVKNAKRMIQMKAVLKETVLVIMKMLKSTMMKIKTILKTTKSILQIVENCFKLNMRSQKKALKFI